MCYVNRIRKKKISLERISVIGTYDVKNRKGLIVLRRQKLESTLPMLYLPESYLIFTLYYSHSH